MPVAPTARRPGLCDSAGHAGHSTLADATSRLEFIDIYAGLTDNELRHNRQRHPEEGSIVTGFFQQAREEGIEQG